MKGRAAVHMICHRSLLVLLLVLIITGLTATISCADEANRFDLTLSVSEEYNDNLYETRDHQQADFITRITPGFSLSHQAPLWDWNLRYRLEYLHFARSTRGDELNHWLDLRGTVRLIDEFLLLDIADSYSMVSLDDRTGSANQNLFTRQSEQNLFSVSPYLLLRPTSQLEIKTGYRYRNQYYSSPLAIDWYTHGAFLDGSYALTPKCDAVAGTEFVRTFPNQGENYDRLTIYAGVNYQYAHQSRIALRGGYSLLRFQGGATRRSPYWNAEIVQVFGRNTAFLYSGVEYQTDPLLSMSERRYVRGRLQRGFERLTLGATAAYAQVREGIVGQEAYSTVEAGLDGTYEHTDKLSSHANILSIWYRDSRTLPCRLLAGAGLTYAMPDDLSLALDYQLISNREQLSGGDATYTNRYILTLSKIW